MKEILKNKKMLIICGIIAAIIIITIVVVIIAGNNGAFGSIESLKGKFDLIEMEEDGMVTTKDDIDVLKKFNIETTIEFNDDKTGTLDVMGEKIDFKIDGNTLKADDITMDYRFQGDKVVIEKNNQKLTFAKHAD